MTRPLIIAIDGPSGAGKSTLGRMVARALNLLYIDTGSMYRAVALAVMESSISASDDVSVGSLANRIDIDLKGDPDSLSVTLDGRDVTEQIRSEEVTDLSSIISTIPAVRRAMVARQREMGKRGAVLNGRDIGTVRDTTRIDSPLKTAADAIVVDSTGLTIDEVFEQLMAAVEEKAGSLLTNNK